MLPMEVVKNAPKYADKGTRNPMLREMRFKQGRHAWGRAHVSNENFLI